MLKHIRGSIIAVAALSASGSAISAELPKHSNHWQIKNYSTQHRLETT